MWNIIKEYRHYILSALLVVIPLFVLNASGKDPANLFWFDRAALRITAPIQHGLSWSINGFWDGMQHYLFLYDAKKDNQNLAELNRKLLNEISSFREVSLENERLHKLVKFSETLTGNHIVAQVVAQDILPEFRTIRVNKGTSAGVARGMAVLTHEGIVGRVIRVDRNYADVLTLLDSSSNVAALVQRNRSRGVVEGHTENLLRMKHIRRTDDIRVGDLVVSSGIGSIFPKGLVIGSVINVKKKNYGITQTVEVYPSVDFSKLEEVLIVKPGTAPIDAITLTDVEKPAEKPEKSEKTAEKGAAEKVVPGASGEKPAQKAAAKTEKPSAEVPKKL